MSVYVDNNATSPVPKGHYEAVAKTLEGVDGNPSSIHSGGQAAKVALEEARSAVANTLGAEHEEVIFTSGATEANNLLLQGWVGACQRKSGVAPHVVASAIEHPSVIVPLEILAEKGACTLTIAPVDKSGRLAAEELKHCLRPETKLVAVMHANNETGTIQDIEGLVSTTRSHAPEALFHCDGVQMLGKTSLSHYGNLGIDSASFSAHKVGGFKGVGCLYLRAGREIDKVIAGGGQESSRRAGTENLQGIVSFGIRARELAGELDGFFDATNSLRHQLVELLYSIPGAEVHGDLEKTLPNTVNFHIDGIPGEDILLNLDLNGIRASSGSACSSGVVRGSRTLLGMGYSQEVAMNSIRVSFHDSVQPKDVVKLIDVLRDVVSRSR